MRAFQTILVLALAALVASVNGNSIAGKIKEKLTPSSMQEHEKKPEQQLPSSSFDQQQQNIQKENLPQQQQQNIPRENLPQQQRGFVQPQQQDFQTGKLSQQQQHGFTQHPHIARSGEINVEQKRTEQQHMPENVNPNLPMTSDRQEHAQEQMDQKNIGMQQPSDIRHQGQRFETSEQQQPKLRSHSSQAFGSNPRDVAADQQAAGQTWWGTSTYQYSWPTYSQRYAWPQQQFRQYPYVYHSHPGGNQPHFHAPGGGMYYY